MSRSQSSIFLISLSLTVLIRTNLSLDFSPLIISISFLLTENSSDKNPIISLLALPFSGGADTAILYPSPYLPIIFVSV
jgi:hypothetical protein